MAHQRPTGVTVLAVLQFIGGALSLLFGLASVFFGSLFSTVGADFSTDAAPGLSGTDLGAAALLLGLSSIILGVIGLIAGYGLFTLKGWGWTLAIVFALGNIVRNLTNLLHGANIPGAIVGIVISGLILYYLYRPNVKRAFGKA